MRTQLSLWLNKAFNRFEELRSREEGQALVEYGLILALIAVVCIGALTLLGTNVNAILNYIATAVGNAIPA
jgi:pilus assembly protein Flp/PilA